MSGLLMVTWMDRIVGHNNPDTCLIQIVAEPELTGPDTRVTVRCERCGIDLMSFVT